VKEGTHMLNQYEVLMALLPPEQYETLADMAVSANKKTGIPTRKALVLLYQMSYYMGTLGEGISALFKLANELSKYQARGIDNIDKRGGVIGERRRH